MEIKDKEYLESLGYEVRNNCIYQYIDSNTEPKIYWNNRPKTFEYQIWGWQLVAHESKVEMFIKNLNK